MPGLKHQEALEAKLDALVYLSGRAVFRGRRDQARGFAAVAAQVRDDAMTDQEREARAQALLEYWAGVPCRSQ